MNDWNMIGQAYAQKLPHIMEVRATGKRARTSPYFIDWSPMFTPIESYAWQDIRGQSLPLYPQFPVDGVFIDFADPYFKIGIELDGKGYHDHKKDLLRDSKLCLAGWRIFRIPGKNSLPSHTGSSPIGNQAEFTDSNSYSHALIDWGCRWSEGFFWALSKYYYSAYEPGTERSAASRILDAHRIVDFPLHFDLLLDDHESEGQQL